MYIKRLMILCLLMTCSAGLFAQSGTLDSLQGAWEIEKAVVKVVAQRGGATLSESTVTDLAQIRQIKPVILLQLLFAGQQYSAQYQAKTESGTFAAASGTLQLQKDVEELPPSFIPYVLQTETMLQVTLPQVYYRDAQHNQPVKQSVICFFHKKP